jgi:hypothetical protein
MEVCGPPGDLDGLPRAERGHVGGWPVAPRGAAGGRWSPFSAAVGSIHDGRGRGDPFRDYSSSSGAPWTSRGWR